jgi:arylsulfatase A-like enzyme
MSDRLLGRKLDRRGFLGTASATALAAAGRRPNILYIMTDQQHAGMMSCGGNPWVKTPAMDSLAASGVRFERAYSGNPVCMPARTSMMTGRYPSHFGIRGNGALQVPRETLATCMGHVFRAAGYRTVFGGKTHWPKPMTPESIGFENLTANERDVLADECASFLRAKHDKPFLLVASFINPHDICFMAIDAYTKGANLPPMYPSAKVERECVAEAERMPAGVSREEFFSKHCPPAPDNLDATIAEPAALGNYNGFRGWVRQHWTTEDWRLHRWAYCRLTERVDAEIGRVLAALRESGLERDTVVVFTSDHGDMDSAHRFEHKSLPYEESARVPFIVSWKGRTRAGHVNKQDLVSSTVDLMPTLCDYAGITPPSGLPGRSVRAAVEKDRPASWREELIIECENSRCLRTTRYKYSVFVDPEPRELLIDMEKDPGEKRNLATDGSMAKVLAAHRAKLRERIEERVDDFGRSLMAQVGKPSPTV